MGIGPYVRRAFGPFEKPLTDAYRTMLVDLDALAERLSVTAPARRILEVGCGEGLFTQRLAERYPDAEVFGIDITPRVGRLFSGDAGRVHFLDQAIADFSRTHAQAFDLVVVCDVLHHVPWELHGSFLAAIKPTIRPGGCLAVKDWEPWPSFSHLLCYLSCRYITGDRVRYPTAADLHALLNERFPEAAVLDEFRLRPSKHNLAVVLQTPGDDRRQHGHGRQPAF